MYSYPCCFFGSLVLCGALEFAGEFAHVCLSPFLLFERASPPSFLPSFPSFLCSPLSSPPQVKIYFALMHLHPLDVRITYRGTPGSDVQDAEELTLSTMAQLNDAR